VPFFALAVQAGKQVREQDPAMAPNNCIMDGAP
jgi:hypothetical protein